MALNNGEISAASLMFMIMMQICKDNQFLQFEEIQNYQSRMLSVPMEL